MVASSTGTRIEDRLAESGELVISRVVSAPRALVYQAWVDPEHFARWFRPSTSTMPYCRLDARVGGELHFQHRHETVDDVWIRGFYDEVVPGERLAFTVYFSNQAGDRCERPGFPREMRIVVDLAEVAGGTRITVRQYGLEVDQGEVQGWRESLDQLAEILESDAIA